MCTGNGRSVPGSYSQVYLRRASSVAVSGRVAVGPGDGISNLDRRLGEAEVWIGPDDLPTVSGIPRASCAASRPPRLLSDIVTGRRRDGVSLLVGAWVCRDRCCRSRWRWWR